MTPFRAGAAAGVIEEKTGFCRRFIFSFIPENSGNNKDGSR